jgi:hypothetical protein
LFPAATERRPPVNQWELKTHLDGWTLVGQGNFPAKPIAGRNACVTFLVAARRRGRSFAVDADDVSGWV